MDSTERSLLVADCVEKVGIAAHMDVLVKFHSNNYSAKNYDSYRSKTGGSQSKNWSQLNPSGTFSAQSAKSGSVVISRAPPFTD